LVAQCKFFSEMLRAILQLLRGVLENQTSIAGQQQGLGAIFETLQVAPLAARCTNEPACCGPHLTDGAEGFLPGGGGTR
jgi:hypothetical protein